MNGIWQKRFSNKNKNKLHKAPISVILMLSKMEATRYDTKRSQARIQKAQPQSKQTQVRRQGMGKRDNTRLQVQGHSYEVIPSPTTSKV